MKNAVNTDLLPIGNKLSNREREVVQLISTGLTRKETAQVLYLSSYTIDDHIKSAIEKTGALNTANLVRISLMNGIIE
jgi:DNA-binding CsgD family transcriptional regulator